VENGLIKKAMHPEFSAAARTAGSPSPVMQITGTQIPAETMHQLNAGSVVQVDVENDADHLFEISVVLESLYR
jgi:hypothetical protein